MTTRFFLLARLRTPAAVLFAIAAFAGRSDAILVFDVIEDDGDVLLSASGSIDLDATLSYGGIAGNGRSFFSSAQGTVSVGDDVSADYFEINVSGWTPIGTDSDVTFGSGSGDRVALYSDPDLGLPQGYVSGTPLSGSAVFADTNFADLGVVPGSFTTTISNPDTGVSDSIVVNVIPEPSAAHLIGALALAAAVLRVRRR